MLTEIEVTEIIENYCEEWWFRPVCDICRRPTPSDGIAKNWAVAVSRNGVPTFLCPSCKKKELRKA